MVRLGVVVIVGVGLIGGSIGLALRSRGLAGTVRGVDRDPSQLDLALSRGAIDEVSPSLVEAVPGADLIVLCVPVGGLVGQVHELLALLESETTLTDVGSTKAEILARITAEPELARRFVGSHPLAGRERCGVRWAEAELFQDRPIAITVTPQTSRSHRTKVHRFWESLGGQVLEMDAQEHDRCLAWTSHLPHVLAAALSRSTPVETHRTAAGAYRDMTRVAASDASLWVDIFESNRQAVLDAMTSYQRHLQEFISALERGDRPALIDWWNQGQQRRLLFEGQIADPSPIRSKTATLSSETSARRTES